MQGQLILTRNGETVFCSTMDDVTARLVATKILEGNVTRHTYRATFQSAHNFHEQIWEAHVTCGIVIIVASEDY